MEAQTMEVVSSQAAPSSTDINEAGKVEVPQGQGLEFEDIISLGIIDDLSKTPTKQSKKLAKDIVPEAKAEDPNQGEVDLKTKTTAKDQKEEVGETEKTEKKVRTFEMTKGDSKVSIDYDYKVKIPTGDAEDGEVTFKELVQDYNGRVNWAKSFKTLSEQKKGLEAEKGQVSGLMNDVMEAVNGKNIDLMLRTAAKYMRLNEADANKAIQNYYQSALEQIKAWEGMNPDQRELQQYKIKEKERESSAERENKFKEAETAKEQLISKISTVLQQQGMSPQLFASRYGELDNLWASNPELRAHHQNNKDAWLNPERVGSYHNDCIRFEKVDNVFNSLPDLVRKQAKEDTVKDFLSGTLLENPQFTESDLKEIVLEALKPKSGLSADEKEAVKAKVKSSQPQVQKKQLNQRAQPKEVLTFDDLEIF